jgi:hypothetical protein
VTNPFTYSPFDFVVIEIYKGVGVVIADHRDFTTFPHKAKAFCRSGSVPHDVSQAENLLDPLLIDVGEDGLKGVYIGVYV